MKLVKVGSINKRQCVTHVTSVDVLGDNEITIVIVIASKVALEDSLKPAWLVVMLTCKRVDSSIVASKLIWEESNERACIVDALGPRGGPYATAVRQDIPNAPMYIDGEL